MAGSSDKVQRWASTLLGLGVVGLAAAISFHKSGPVRVTPVDAGDAASPVADLHPTETAPSREGGLFVSDLRDIELDAGSGPGALPAGAPRSVRFGVVLVNFAGAQGAPAAARPKKDALDLATRLAADAKSDFHGAVARGDSGSADDVGRIARGFLEPATEYVLFTLPVSGTSDPVETPRGYWIVKRIE